MRTGLLLLLASTAACTTTDTIDPPDDVRSPTSVRERLEDRTRLLISRDASTGSITAQKKNGAEWDVGTVALPFETGEMDVSSDANDSLTIESLQINFDDIALPPSLFGGREAMLTNVSLELEDEIRANATWASDDDVAIIVELPLVLHWSISTGGAPTELGSPRLPKVPVGLRLVGDADHVEASLSAFVEGELWDWAGILKLSALELGVEANLAPPL